MTCESSSLLKAVQMYAIARIESLPAECSKPRAEAAEVTLARIEELQSVISLCKGLAEQFDMLGKAMRVDKLPDDLPTTAED